MINANIFYWNKNLKLPGDTNREEKCDITLPSWQHYFWMTTKPTTTVMARRSAKNDVYINNKQQRYFACASRYFVHFFAVTAPLRHETE